ncbi:MAG TPA: Gfo/Idh/MocA family oxidoreductase [Saprospiraceae bacterium]|nr:Gfo/Idh/MocA family oxidoreductase [Saprospiraceae bacterium]
MLNFAIIGCGRISYKHVEALVNNYTEARLVAVCDTINEKAVQRASEYKNKMHAQQIQIIEPDVYVDYQHMLKSNLIDVVSIATESGKHAEIAIECMKAGKNVIVEKPMALSTLDADRMIAVSEENNVNLSVCFQNRFNPAIQILRKAVEKRRFGKIYALNARVLWTRDENYYSQAPWRGTYEQDGGCLMNQSIHNIDLMQWMAGSEPKLINGMMGKYLRPIDAEDYGTLQVRFENGVIGNVEGTVNVFPSNLEETLTILGTEGTVVIGGKAVNKILVWDFKDGQDSIVDVQFEGNLEIDSVYGKGHIPLYKNVINHILYDEKLLVDGYEGKKAMQIILCGYESDQKKRAVDFSSSIKTLDFKVNNSRCQKSEEVL